MVLVENNRLSNLRTIEQTLGLTTYGMLTVLMMSTLGSPIDFSGTKTKDLGFRA